MPRSCAVSGGTTRAPGLDDSRGPPGAVGVRAVRQRVLEQDSHAIGEAPARVREQGVDPGPRERLRGSGHGGGPDAKGVKRE